MIRPKIFHVADQHFQTLKVLEALQYNKAKFLPYCFLISSLNNSLSFEKLVGEQTTIVTQLLHSLVQYTTVNKCTEFEETQEGSKFNAFL